MNWNGHPVIDLDAHIVERADRFYGDYIDPAYRDAGSARSGRAQSFPKSISSARVQSAGPWPPTLARTSVRTSWVVT